MYTQGLKTSIRKFVAELLFRIGKKDISTKYWRTSFISQCPYGKQAIWLQWDGRMYIPRRSMKYVCVCSHINSILKIQIYYLVLSLLPEYVLFYVDFSFSVFFAGLWGNCCNFTVLFWRSICLTIRLSDSCWGLFFMNSISFHSIWCAHNLWFYECHCILFAY